ncbi:reverse transcriptase domain-containing protein [Tanacetum coccineum]
MDKVQKPSSQSAAQVPPPENQDSIFIEIPKPKAKKTVQEPNSPEPNSYQPKLPYPERMKVRENDKPSAQHSRFLKMFKQLRLEIGLKDALVEMPKFNKWLSGLLRNKEKLEEIAITTVNAECSAIIMNKVPEKLEDPGKFLIPCALQELDRTNALADSGASINLLPHSIYKQLGLGALTPTRMTLELANRSITHPMGIAEDVVVRVDGFTFLADFVVVDVPDSEDNIDVIDAFLSMEFPAGRKEEYEMWAMKMEYWIMNKHIAVQRETKARTILLQSLPEDHTAIFTILDMQRGYLVLSKPEFAEMLKRKLRKMQVKYKGCCKVFEQESRLEDVENGAATVYWDAAGG